MNLKDLQEKFLTSVTSNRFEDEIQQSMIPGGQLDKQSCLDAYRNDYTARLTSALGDNFESLWSVLGDEDFFKLCANYIRSHPSALYDLGQYGNAFPDFLKNHEIKYLSELASLEIEFRRLFNAAPKEALQVDAFSKLLDPSKIIFTFTPHAYLSISDYPLYVIWEKRGELDQKSFEEIQWIPENILMYNSTGTVKMKYLSLFQANLFKNLNNAKNLEESLNSSGQGNEEEVSDLFSFLVSNSLILNYK